MARWEALRRDAADTYGWLLGEDVARELARIDLPLSTYTQWYWKIDLHNLLHFLRLRVDDHAQWENPRVRAGDGWHVAARRPPRLRSVAGLRRAGRAAELRGERKAIASLLRAEGDGLAVRDGASLDAAGLRDFGLAAREARELLAKVEVPERPDFSLDLSAMRSAEEIEAKMRDAVPQAEQTQPQ